MEGTDAWEVARVLGGEGRGELVARTAGQGTALVEGVRGCGGLVDRVAGEPPSCRVRQTYHTLTGGARMLGLRRTTVTRSFGT